MARPGSRQALLVACRDTEAGAAREVQLGTLPEACSRQGRRRQARRSRHGLGEGAREVLMAQEGGRHHRLPCGHRVACRRMMGVVGQRDPWRQVVRRSRLQGAYRR